MVVHAQHCSGGRARGVLGRSGGLWGVLGGSGAVLVVLWVLQRSALSGFSGSCGIRMIVVVIILVVVVVVVVIIVVVVVIVVSSTTTGLGTPPDPHFGLRTPPNS